MPKKYKSGAYFPEDVYLTQIEQDSRLALDALAELREGMTWWLTRGRSADSPEALSPKMARNAHSILTHVASVSRLLYAGKRTDNWIVRRCRRMRHLVGVRSGKEIENFAVRNSWEHIDERLDILFKNYRLGGRITVEAIRFIEPDSRSSQQVLHGIDPKNEHLYYLGDVINLRAVEKELQVIQGKIPAARDKLKSGRVAPLSK